MANKKLPAAKNWQERPVESWNTTTVKAYLSDKHPEKIGTPYFPFGTWDIEQKMIKTALTEYGGEVVKKFIDECLRTYEPSPQYAGISFGFMFKFRNRELQRIIFESKKAEKADERIERLRQIEDDDLDWI